MRSWSLIPLLSLALLQTASAQWQDVRKVGTGGESSVSTDGKGNVYLVAHIPCQLFKSTDWGNTFSLVQPFNGAMCDMNVMAWPDSNVNVTYIRNGVVGIGSWFSTDSGKTMTQGSNVDGPLDREWTTVNPQGTIFMDFSHGYIGGPKSTGVFVVTSSDHGKTFSDPVRADKEPADSYPVDPYISSSTDGRVYCMWQVTTDMNTIDSYRVATTMDGKTFSDPVTVATFPKELNGQKVDTQERWILGSLLGYGQNGVVVVYPGYEFVKVDGQEAKAFVLHYTVSTDGGKAFSPGQTVLSDAELKEAIRGFRKNHGDTLTYPYYAENLPWLAQDGTGKVHLAFTDNRDGAKTVDGKPLAEWRVRHIYSTKPELGFGKSEPVSEDYAAVRPPMDFIGCAADSKYVYISWTETPDAQRDFMFTGQLWLGRKPVQ